MILSKINLCRAERRPQLEPEIRYSWEEEWFHAAFLVRDNRPFFEREREKKSYHIGSHLICRCVVAAKEKLHSKPQLIESTGPPKVII